MKTKKNLAERLRSIAIDYIIVGICALGLGLSYLVVSLSGNELIIVSAFSFGIASLGHGLHMQEIVNEYKPNAKGEKTDTPADSRATK